MPDSQNFNTVSGISTFNNLNVANNLSVGASITSGTMAYFGGEVGIGTTNNNGFLTGPTNLKAHVEGSLGQKWSTILPENLQLLIRQMDP